MPYRLGIMVGGRLSCTGDPHDITSRFCDYLVGGVLKQQQIPSIWLVECKKVCNIQLVGQLLGKYPVACRASKLHAVPCLFMTAAGDVCGAFCPEDSTQLPL